MALTMSEAYDEIIRIAAGHFQFPGGSRQPIPSPPFSDAFQKEFVDSLVAFWNADDALVSTSAPSGTLVMDQKRRRCRIIFADGSTIRSIRLEFLANFSTREDRRTLQTMLSYGVLDGDRSFKIHARRDVRGRWAFIHHGGSTLGSLFPETQPHEPSLTTEEISQFIAAISTQFRRP